MVCCQISLFVILPYVMFNSNVVPLLVHSLRELPTCLEKSANLLHMTCVCGAAFEVTITAVTIVIVREKVEVVVVVVVAVVVATGIMLAARINGKHWVEVVLLEKVVNDT